MALSLVLASQLLRSPIHQDAIHQESEHGKQSRAIDVPERRCALCQRHGFAARSVCESATAYGDGSQCATMTANGAKIAATPAWLAQNAAIAGVAVFAIAVSSNTTVGR